MNNWSRFCFLISTPPAVVSGSYFNQRFLLPLQRKFSIAIFKSHIPNVYIILYTMRICTLLVELVCSLHKKESKIIDNESWLYCVDNIIRACLKDCQVLKQNLPGEVIHCNKPQPACHTQTLCLKLNPQCSSLYVGDHCVYFNFHGPIYKPTQISHCRRIGKALKKNQKNNWHGWWATTFRFLLLTTQRFLVHYS